MIHKICEFTSGIHEFCRNFNKDIRLREFLWKNGFFAEMKSLPGLVKQEHEALKGITISKYQLSLRSDLELDSYMMYGVSNIGT